jgi:hypothetical protein
MDHSQLNRLITDTLDERGTRYGVFADQAFIAEALNVAMTSSPGWNRLAPDQREALRIIQNKVARILNGDPNYSDSWHDIAGYATLVDGRLKSEGL